MPEPSWLALVQAAMKEPPGATATDMPIWSPVVVVLTFGLMKRSLTSKAGCVHEIVWAWPSLAAASVNPVGLRLGVEGFGMTMKSVAGFASGAPVFGHFRLRGQTVYELAGGHA